LSETHKVRSSFGHSKNASYTWSLTRLILGDVAGALLLWSRSIIASVVINSTIDRILDHNEVIVVILNTLVDEAVGSLWVLHLFASARGEERRGCEEGRTHDSVALTLLSLVAIVDTRTIAHSSNLRPSLTKKFALYGEKTRSG
jgi:hypothetical protein